jgi:hypothetical protein
MDEVITLPLMFISEVLIMRMNRCWRRVLYTSEITSEHDWL